MKKVKHLIMIEEIVNEDLEKTAKSVKSSDEVAEAVNKMKKSITRNKFNILWFVYQHDQIFKKFKVNENFIAMVKKLGISQPAILFKISIVKFVNEYPRMKKSSLSLNFLKNNFKIMKEICHENASELK